MAAIPSSPSAMPLLDDDRNAVGCVQLESRENGNYTRNFMIIDFSTHKLRFYPEEAEFSNDLSTYDVQLEINCQYITKVEVFFLFFFSGVMWYLVAHKLLEHPEIFYSYRAFVSSVSGVQCFQIANGLLDCSAKGYI